MLCPYLRHDIVLFGRRKASKKEEAKEEDRPSDVVTVRISEDALSEMVAARDIDGLCRALNYANDFCIRAKAANALRNIADPRTIGPLIQALGTLYYFDDAFTNVRFSGEENRYEHFDERISECDWTTRFEAKRALNKIGEPAVDPLIQALNDPTYPATVTGIGCYYYRKWLVITVHDLYTRPVAGGRAIDPLLAVDALIRTFGDSWFNWHTEGRRCLIDYLVEIGEPAIPALKRALAYPQVYDDNPKVAQGARLALERIEKSLKKREES